MGLLKGIFRFTAHKINDGFTEKELKENGGKAYCQNGRNMKKAKKQGKHINGSQGYSRQLEKLNNKTNKKSKRREQFIDDIFS